MNNDLTDEQRARALDLHRLYHRTLTGVESAVSDGGLLDGDVKAWLEVEEFILQSHTCRPVWRPTTRDEIQAGWEVRARRHNGPEVGWGVAHDQDDDGDWLTEARGLLTHELVGWTYETTAPAPEPKPDPRVERFAKAMYLAYTGKPWEEISEESRVSYLRDGAEVLRVFDALPEGEQS